MIGSPAQPGFFSRRGLSTVSDAALPIDTDVLAIFVPVVIILVTTPGPNTLYLVATGLSRGARAAGYATIGIAMATFCHIVLTAVGVASLLAASAAAFDVFRLAGAAYLLWLAYVNLRRDRRSRLEISDQSVLLQQLKNGFVTNLLNPKSIVFCVFFLPQFVSIERGVVFVQILIFGIILIVIGLCSDMMFAIASGKIAHYLRSNSTFLALQKWLLSVVFITLAVRLLTLKQAG